MGAQVAVERDRVITDTRPELARYARSRGLQPADAEDVAQEVATRALEQGEAFAQHAVRRAWLFRVTSNVLVDHWRRQSPAPLSAGDLISTSLDPAERVVHREQAEIAMRALGNISRRYAQVFWDHDVEGVPAADLAVELGVNRVAFRQILHRARAAVRAEHQRLGGSSAALVCLVPPLRRLSRWREWTFTVAIAPGLAFGALLPPPMLDLPVRPGTATTEDQGHRTSDALQLASHEGETRAGALARPSVDGPSQPPTARTPGRKMTEVVCVPGGLVERSCLRSGPANPAYRYIIVRSPLNGHRCPPGQQDLCDYQPSAGTSGDQFDRICDNLPSQPVAYCTYGDQGKPDDSPRKDTDRDGRS